MTKAVAKQEEYDITASNGRVYRVTGTAQQAQELGAWIERRIKSGDPDLKETSGVPDSRTVFHDAPSETPIDRSGFLNGVDAFGRGIARGATSNLADEATAAADAILPVDRLGGAAVKSGWTDGFGNAYAHNVDLQRRIDKADDEQHGMASGIGKLLGGAAQAYLAGRAMGSLPMVDNFVNLATRAAPIRSAMALGGIGGAASGLAAGAGEGDTAASRLRSAAGGALFGGGAGAVLAPVAGSLAPAIARYAKVLVGRGTDKEAVHQIVQALHRDGYDVTSPSGVKVLKDELSSYMGKPVSLADIGSATRARAGVGLRAPSDAQQQAIDTVMQRAQGQGLRLSGDVRANVAPRTDVHALDEALVAQREAEAMPLRDKALFIEGPGYGEATTPQQALATPTNTVSPEAADAGLRRMLGLNPKEAQPQFLPVPRAENAISTATRQARIPDDPQLQQLARLPLAQRALGRARALAQDEVNTLAVQGKDISHLPDVTAPGSNLDMRTLDYMKRYLDSEVSKLGRGADTDTFKAAEYQNVKALRDVLRERMREVVPEYGDYLDTYRGSSEMLDALREGRSYTKLDPEQIAAEQAKRSTAGQELYRVGAARDLEDTLRSTTDGRNPAARILNSPEQRDQLAATGVSPENAAQLNKAVGIERQLNLLPAELSGSATAQRLAAAQDADAGVHASLPFNPSSGISWLGALGRTALNRASTARNAAVNEALLPRVLEQDPAAISRTIQELEQAGQKQVADQIRNAVAARSLTRLLGNQIGTDAALTEQQ